MKISGIINKIKTPVMALALASVPLKTVKHPFIPVERDAFNKTTITLTKDITHG